MYASFFFVLALAFAISGCSSDASSDTPLPPANEVAFTARFGPESIAPGAERMRCLDAPGPLEDVWVSGWRATARFTHHVNVWERTSGTAEYAVPTTCAIAAPVGPGLFGVEQPELEEVFGEAPEYTGLAMLLRAAGDMLWDVHEVNTTGETGTVDVRAEFFKAQKHDLVMHGFSLNNSKSLYVAPGETKLLRYETTSPAEEIKIIAAVAHVHAHNEYAAMSVNGVEVYRSTDWTAPVRERYDSLHGSDLVVSPNSKVSWECLVKNTTSAPLRNTNSVQTGEMCIMYGTLIGPRWIYEVP